jgi:hypothetical protein
MLAASQLAAKALASGFGRVLQTPGGLRHTASIMQL